MPLIYPLAGVPTVYRLADMVTSHLVGGVAAATDAVCDTVALDRRRVRETAVRRFSAERMVDDYLRGVHAGA
jgi:hypothetical protein